MMLHLGLSGAIATAPVTLAGPALAFDDVKYPNLKDQRVCYIVPNLRGQPSHDQTKPWGFGQAATLSEREKGR
jgi:hypothetical protein